MDLYFTLGAFMDIKNFKAGSYKKGYEYHYFLPGATQYSYCKAKKEIFRGGLK
jgi:hypothetical protein